jgi:membrane-bound inhibitor of C-type lysozyme
MMAAFHRESARRESDSMTHSRTRPGNSSIRRVALLCALCVLCAEKLLSAAAVAQVPEGNPLSIRYKCDNKQSLQVDYNIRGKGSRAQVSTNKKTWIMKPEASESGTRYTDARKTMQWQLKDREGSFTDLKTKQTTHCKESISNP